MSLGYIIAAIDIMTGILLSCMGFKFITDHESGIDRMRKSEENETGAFLMVIGAVCIISAGFIFRYNGG